MNTSLIIQHNSTGAILTVHENCWQLGNIVRPTSADNYTVIGYGFDPIGPCPYMNCNH